MPLRTTVSKAFNQLARRDPAGIERYRAELRYFHLPQRGILGIAPPVYTVIDEAYTIPDEALRKLIVLEQAAVDHVAADIRASRTTAPPPRPGG